MPTLKEDRQRLIAVMAEEPLEELKKEVASKRVSLGQHLDGHKNCSERCVVANNLRNEIEITAAAIRVRQTQ